MEKYNDQFESLEESNNNELDREIGQQEEQSLKDSMRYDAKISRELQKGRDQYYNKRQQKRSSSPSSQVWNDED